MSATIGFHSAMVRNIMFGGDRCTVQYSMVTVTASDRLAVHIGEVAGYRFGGAHLGVARGHLRRHMEHDVRVAEGHSQNKIGDHCTVQFTISWSLFSFSLFSFFLHTTRLILHRYFVFYLLW